jgi:hypothetical protein
MRHLEVERVLFGIHVVVLVVHLAVVQAGSEIPAARQ